MKLLFGAVLVVDPDAEVRRSVRDLLARIGCETIEAPDGRTARRAMEHQGAAVVILEVRLPDTTGYELCRELRDRYGNGLAIVILSAARRASDRVAGLLIGADDVVGKPFDESDLLARTRRLLERATRSSESNGTGRADGTGSRLTPREREVLRLLAAGCNQAEIARTLTISGKTVGTHIQRVLSKVGAHSRVELVARTHLEHLVEPPAHRVAS